MIKVGAILLVSVIAAADKEKKLDGPLPDIEDTAYIPEKVLKKGD